MAQEEEKPEISLFKKLNWLDRFLAIWIFLAMVIGIILGNFVPATSQALQKGSFVGVSIPIAIGLLVMMYPILCKVQYETMHRLFRTRELWFQLLYSIIINWIIAPLLMLGLGWAFLPDRPHLRSGLILVGLARCIAMVLIWTTLAGADTQYCAILVSVNSLLQIILYPPLSVLFIRIIGRSNDLATANISYAIVAKSVAVFLGIPLGAAILTRLVLRRLMGERRYSSYFLAWCGPFSLVGLLFTILVLFASQGRRVVQQIVAVVRVAAPLFVYFIIMFFGTLYAFRKWSGLANKKVPWDMALTQSFTAASNNFELAIAIAVAVFGASSDEALAATVGPLIEVPVLLGLVYASNWLKGRW